MIDIVLTSFGVGVWQLQFGRDRDTLFDVPFQRVPPLYFPGDSGETGLDYAPLFLADRVIIDEESYNRVLEPSPGFERYAQLCAADLGALNSAGRLITKNFDALLRSHTEVWRNATDDDMTDIASWGMPLEATIEHWRRLAVRCEPYFAKYYQKEPPANEDALDSWQGGCTAEMGYIASMCGEQYKRVPGILRRWKSAVPRDDRALARSVIRDFVSYVNFNLILAVECGAAFMDWRDLQPFYERKLALPSGQCQQEAVATARQLFDVLFPTSYRNHHGS